MPETIHTGVKIYTELKQYSSLTGQYTGTTKANDPSDPDYVMPVLDETTCPIVLPTTTSTTLP